MTPRVEVLERIPSTAPLGFQLWDVVTQSPAGRGLVVTARAVDRDGSARALQNGSGVHVVRGFPGLRAAELAAASEGFWASPPALESAVVEVADPVGRYLPVSFRADVPHRGLFEAACGFTGSPAWEAVEAPALSPPAARRPVVPLFSAPSRPTPAGMAVVRADLRLSDTGAPASWALVQVTAPGRSPALGVADGEGRATVMFAYPEPPGFTLSPPGPGRVPLSEQQWTVGIRVYFGAGSPPAPVAGQDGVPELCALLAQQEATALEDATSALQTLQLQYGRELHVKTTGHSSLLVSSVSSP